MIERIFAEKISGARADRPQLAKLMASLKKADVVMVCKLDRVGRSTTRTLRPPRQDRHGMSRHSAASVIRSGTQPHHRASCFEQCLRGCRVRARHHPGAHRKRSQARHGERRQIRPQAEALAVPAREAIKRRVAGETPAAIEKSHAVDVSSVSQAAM